MQASLQVYHMYKQANERLHSEISRYTYCADGDTHPIDTLAHEVPKAPRAHTGVQRRSTEEGQIAWNKQIHNLCPTADSSTSTTISQGHIFQADPSFPCEQPGFLIKDLFQPQAVLTESEHPEGRRA